MNHPATPNSAAPEHDVGQLAATDMNANGSLADAHSDLVATTLDNGFAERCLTRGGNASSQERSQPIEKAESQHSFRDEL
jgi:hypothetical protein